MQRTIGAVAMVVMVMGAEAVAAPPDARAVRAIELLHAARIPEFRALVLADPAVINLPGPAESTPFMYAALYGDAGLLQWLLDRGGDPHRRNAVGATALLWAADDVEMTRVLLDAGADPNVAALDGRTALSVAAHPAIRQLLLDRGATVSDPAPAKADEPRHCPAADSELWRERAWLGLVEGGPAAAAQLLQELHAAGRPRDLRTDAAVRYLRLTQQPDGRWTSPAPCAGGLSSDIAATALAVQALLVYGPPQFEESYKGPIGRASRWLFMAKARSTEERAYRLLGVVWTGATKYGIAAARKTLLQAQRDDGGWRGGGSRSCPHATALAVRALAASGVVGGEPEYRRAVQFLDRAAPTVGDRPSVLR